MEMSDAARSHFECDRRIESLKQLKNILLQNDKDPSLLNQFLSSLSELQMAPFSAVRKYLPEMMQQIGLKNSESLCKLFPALLPLLNDEAPVVVRQCISSGTVLFRKALDIEPDKLFKNLWPWMEKFKVAVYALAFRHDISGGVKFAAVKFVEVTVLHFTADSKNDFIASVLAGGQLEEGGKKLGLLLEQLNMDSSSSSAVIIVVVNCVAEIAKKRPAFCGCILPVLLGLDPGRHGHMKSVQHALKTACLALLKCSHWGALLWRDRLLEALRAMNAGQAAEQAVRRADRALKRSNAERAKRSKKEETILSRKGPGGTEADDVDGDRLLPALQNLAVQQLPRGNCDPDGHMDKSKGFLQGFSVHVDEVSVHVDSRMGDPVAQMTAVISTLLGQGAKGSDLIEKLVPNMDPDLLADIVIANMKNLPCIL